MQSIEMRYNFSFQYLFDDIKFTFLIFQYVQIAAEKMFILQTYADYLFFFGFVFFSEFKKTFYKQHEKYYTSDCFHAVSTPMKSLQLYVHFDVVSVIRGNSHMQLNETLGRPIVAMTFMTMMEMRLGFILTYFFLIFIFDISFIVR